MGNNYMLLLINLVMLGIELILYRFVLHVIVDSVFEFISPLFLHGGSQSHDLDSAKKVNKLIDAVLPTSPMYLPFNVYLDSKRVSILIEAALPTSPMLYLPFNVYLDSKRVSILIEAALPTSPMLYLPFNVYLDSKRVSILIEAV